MHARNIFPLSDLYSGTVTIIGIVLFLGVLELAQKRCAWPATLVRSFVHISIGVMLLFMPFIFLSWGTPVAATMIASCINLSLLRRGKALSYENTPRSSLGTVYYPLSFAFLYVVLIPENRHIFLIAISVMVFADPLAAITGRRAHRMLPTPRGWDAKSLRGSTALFLATCFIVFIGLYLYNHWQAQQIGFMIRTAIAAAVIAAAAEMLSIRGSDNLSVPLLTALGLYLLLAPEYRSSMIWAELLAALVVAVGFRLHFLAFGGALAAFLVGTFTFAVGGWFFSLPILFFFLSSSVLSKLPKKRPHALEGIVARGSAREAAQVLANGILPSIAAVCMLIFEQEIAAAAFFGAVAAATSDTWATEIGTIMSGRPRHLLTGKTVAPGTSGGVSAAGLLGALVGASAIAACGWIGARLLASGLTLSVVDIAVAGFGGCLVDSLLGATLQRKNVCSVCSHMTEKQRHCNRETKRRSGLAWLNNDGVNLVCTAAGAGLAVFLLILGKHSG